MAGPLTGVRIVDLTTVVMGPYATQILGDMGADVIKVEAPQGDVFRYVAPARHPGMGASYLNLNRNKRSIALDLKQAAGKQILLDLLQTADVFVTTVRPQAMRKLQLDYETLSALNPRLIFCGAYGFSEAGPYAGLPAYDDIIQAMSGLAALQRSNPADSPHYVNTIIADKTVGLTMVYAISMALYEREKSGRGQAIEVPMFETMVSFLLAEHLSGETFRPAEGSMGYERLTSEHRRPYQTKDGYIGLLPYTTEQWTRFFELAGRPQMAEDPRVNDPALRSQRIGELYEMLNEIMLERTTTEWMELLKKADIPVAPVLSPADLLTDEHLRARDFFRSLEHPTEGSIRSMAIPVQFSRTPGDIRAQAPNLNEHFAEIVTEIKHQPTE